MATYRGEQEMYPHIRGWLERLLQSKMRDADFISVYETSRMKLARLLLRENLHKYFANEYVTYDIQVDLTGAVIKNNTGHLMFVECKLGKVNLKDVSQLLGYSVVARPFYSIILSPIGIADSLNTLLTSFGRTDILKYHADRTIAVARWDKSRMDIDYSSVIPHGWSIRGL